MSGEVTEVEALEALIAKVREIAAADPEHVYQKPGNAGNNNYATGQCLYVHRGQGSCIVGRGALDLGWITASFEDDYANKSGVSSFLATLHVIDDAETNPDSDAWPLIRWLETVQDEQDCGTPWGKAVYDADHPEDDDDDEEN